mmetsp:Transcript_2924/g.6270  ORF Transcript_2924/g.6270 Transcript_2924/m.6270 type:complete len:496 (+) Transcript_2924:232-1719(+)
MTTAAAAAAPAATPSAAPEVSATPDETTPLLLHAVPTANRIISDSNGASCTSCIPATLLALLLLIALSSVASIVPSSSSSFFGGGTVVHTSSAPVPAQIKKLHVSQSSLPHSRALPMTKSLPYAGIGRPTFNDTADLYTTRYYETRIFFAPSYLHNNILGGGDTAATSTNAGKSKSKSKSRKLNQLTLENPTVSSIVFPDSPPLKFDKIDAEERMDDYILLEGCCCFDVDNSVNDNDVNGNNANTNTAKGADRTHIGFKVRGGMYASLELKTIVPPPPPDNDNGNDIENSSSAYYHHWIKSRRRGYFNVTDAGVMLKFLDDVADSHPEQRRDADAVMRWIRSCMQQQQQQQQQNMMQDGIEPPIKIVRCHKRRRFAYIANGSISVQETDVVFELLSEGEGGRDVHAVSSDTAALLLRSWSAEAVHNDEKVRSIARRWNDVFPRAVTAAAATGADAGGGDDVGKLWRPRYWVRSYPEMILDLPRLLNEQRIGAQTS